MRKETKPIHNKSEGWAEIGIVGVDSGQLLIADPGYLGSQKALKDYDSVLNARGFPKRKNIFDQLCYDRGHDGAGVVFNSGFGDGVYKVYGKFKDCGPLGMRLAEVNIVMIK